MLESLRYLIDLQDVELTLVRLKEKKTQLPLMIERARGTYDQAVLKVEEVRKKQEEAAKERRVKERRLEEEEERLRKLKARISEIKTNKEYQALLLEIDTAKRGQDRDEEELLLLMEQQEVTKQEVIQREKVLAEEKRRFEEEKGRLEAEAAHAEEEMIRLEKERFTLLEQIPQALRKEYDKIKSVRRDMAVVPIRNGTCLGCHIHIPPQLVADIKKQEKILTCMNCHRILYWKGEA